MGKSFKIPVRVFDEICLAFVRKTAFVLVHCVEVGSALWLMSSTEFDYLFVRREREVDVVPADPASIRLMMLNLCPLSYWVDALGARIHYPER